MDNNRRFYRAAAMFLGLLLFNGPEIGAQTREGRLRMRRTRPGEDVSPARRINRQRRRRNAEPATGNRTFDGSNNNLRHPDLGSSESQLLRTTEPHYEDGISSLAGQDRPGPREISNAVFAQEASAANSAGASDYLWLWGQFVDHDIDLTDGTDPPEDASIEVPSGDSFFDPFSTGEQSIALNRSIYDEDTGTDRHNPRQQLNEITAWIDASNVYGSDAERATALRANDGSGQLLTSDGELLPFNELGLPNAGGDSSSLFLAGDVRANEHAGLTAMHTLFVREHNRLAREIAEGDPHLSGEEIYQRARGIVGAQMQVITYNEFLPALLGEEALRPYRGYRSRARVGIANEFSTGAYRFGHSALSPTLIRIDANGSEIAEGHLALRDAFFAPQRLTDEGGIEPLLRGMAAQTCQDIDTFVVDDVRNFLFGPPGSGGFDLVSLNIQRGRDHGLGSYNQLREGYGLRPARDFEDITSDPDVAEKLRAAYGDVDLVDAWVGGLAEDPIRGALVGELVFNILRQQFELLRDGDRFWYERVFRSDELRQLEDTRLSDVIRRNTTIDDEIQDSVFWTH